MLQGEEVLRVLERRAHTRPLPTTTSAPPPARPGTARARPAPSAASATALPNPQHASAGERVARGVLERRTKMTCDDEARSRLFIGCDEEGARRTITSQAPSSWARAVKAYERNSLYVECVRASVFLLNDESECRDAIVRWHEAFRAEQDLIEAARDAEERDFAADIIRNACTAAKHQWCRRRIDEALLLVQRCRKAIDAKPRGFILADSDEAFAALSDQECFRIAFQAMKEIPNHRHAESSKMSPRRNDAPSALKDAGANSVTIDAALDAITAFRVGRTLG